MNRVRIVDLPGVAVDDEVTGKLAFHLLSAYAVIGYARQRGPELALPLPFFADSAETRLELPQYVDACLLVHGERRRAAEAIAERLGRNLGHILLAVRRGDAVNRAARPEWGDADWARWAAVRRVWLGGGLFSGELGRRVAALAQEWLIDVGGVRDLAVALSPARRHLVLYGAARHLNPGAPYGLCLDFGQTAAKSGVFSVRSGVVRPAALFEPYPVSEAWHMPAEEDHRAVGAAMRDFIAGAAARAWSAACAAGMPPGPDVVIAIAAYVQNGRPLGNGLYASMNVLADDVPCLLSAAISGRTGSPIHVHLIHDGTAAAAVHCGEPRAAVLVAGTALGVGFPQEPADHLLRLPPED